METKNICYLKIKEMLRATFKKENRSQTIVAFGLTGLLLVAASGLFKGNTKKEAIKTNSVSASQSHEEKLKQNLENIISGVEGAGKAKVFITFENSTETVYATEERKNKEASEDKSGGEITRKKESDDCEKKYITIKDGEGTEHALAVTEIEPKVRGVIIACPGADNPIVKQRITSAVTTALSITSKRVCVTKSG